MDLLTTHLLFSVWSVFSVVIVEHLARVRELAICYEASNNPMASQDVPRLHEEI